MGPMGGMGRMMGGGYGSGGAATESLGFVLILLLVLAFAGVATVLVRATWRSGNVGADRQRLSVDETLRLRYARGELTGPRYREALVEVLKDRYVRGEVDLDGYEMRLAQLLGLKHPHLSREQAQGLTESERAGISTTAEG